MPTKFDNPVEAPVEAAEPIDTRSPTEIQAQDLVDRWAAEHLHNSDFSRDTPAWNHFHAAQTSLVGLIAAALEG